MSLNLNFAPPIKQAFSKKLLMNTLQLNYDEFENKILPLAKRKIRLQDVGRRKELEKLIIKYKELYERKTKEEADYKRKVKEKSAERSSLPTQKTVRFSKCIQT